MLRVVLLLSMMPTLAMAELDGFLGTWCQQGGPEMMHVEADGLGFNEHTFCEWKSGPVVTSNGFTGVLNCHNVRVIGQDENGAFQTIETDHRRGLDISTGVVRVDSFGARIMEVIVSDWAAPLEVGPCG